MAIDKNKVEEVKHKLNLSGIQEFKEQIQLVQKKAGELYEEVNKLGNMQISVDISHEHE